MKIFSSVAVIASLFLSMPDTAIADNTEDMIIDKVVKAYGGSKLTKLKSISVESEYFQRSPGQGYSPGVDELKFYKRESHFNPAEQVGKTKFEMLGLDHFYSMGNFASKNKSVRLDYVHDQYNYDDGETGYYQILGGYLRGIDTILAYELNSRRSTAEYRGKENYRGKSNSIISYEFPFSPPLFLTIDDETGYIIKMERRFEERDLTVRYLFDNHKKTNGVLFAQNYTLFQNNHLDTMVMKRSVKINRVSKKELAIDEFLSSDWDYLESLSEPTVALVSPGYHHVTISGNSSSFVDSGDYLISVGSNAGLKARHEAYVSSTNNTKPIKYHVITHHHNDHLDSVQDAYDLGATIVAPSSAMATVKARLVNGYDENRFLSVDQSVDLGAANMYVISTYHTNEFGLLYAKDAKTIFEADHYGADAIQVPVRAFFTGYSLFQAVEPLNSDIENIARAHGRKILKWSDFAIAVEDYKNLMCKTTRQLCS